MDSITPPHSPTPCRKFEGDHRPSFLRKIKKANFDEYFKRCREMEELREFRDSLKYRKITKEK